MPEFINPYNFVPLGKERKNAVKDEDERLTGCIEYSVLTKTPLFIPNTSSDTAFKMPNPDKIEPGTEAKEHKRRDFFSYNELDELESGKYYEDTYFKPVIPGSEIRGMFRSSYEILTQSCMSAVDADVSLSKRTSQVYKAGLLKKTNNGYELYEADDNLWRTTAENSTEDQGKWRDEYYKIKSYRQKDFREGEKISFKQVKRTVQRGGRSIPINSLAKEVSKDFSRQGEYIEGYILKGEDGPETKSKQEKHVCHIFSMPEIKKPIQEIKTLEDLEQVLDTYKVNEENAYKEYYENLKEFQKGETGELFPVYYDKIPVPVYYKGRKTNSILLSPASITRETYKNKIRDLIGNFNSCSDSSALCPACSLFGTVGKSTNETDKDKKEFAVASRIRFSDLQLSALQSEDKKNNKDYYVAKPVILPALSSPKISNTEFYLKQPEDGAKFWTYDYYIDGKGKVKSYTNSIHPEILGRKFYWHKIPASLSFPNVKASKLNTTIRPVKEEIRFSGKLYFDKISQKELDQLIWLLNAGDAAVNLVDKKYGYKLGAAKPLGLGSIAVSVDRVITRKLKVDEKEQTIIYINEDYKFEVKEGLFDNAVADNYKKALKFTAIANADEIRYPIADGQKENEEGFTWFVNNHKGAAGMPNEREQMRIKEHLVAMEPRVQDINTSINQPSHLDEGNANGNCARPNNGVITGDIKEAVVQSYYDRKKKEDNYNRIKFKIGTEKAQTLQTKNTNLTPEQVKEKYPEGSIIKVVDRGERKDASGIRKIYELIE